MWHVAVRFMWCVVLGIQVLRVIRQGIKKSFAILSELFTLYERCNHILLNLHGALIAQTRTKCREQPIVWACELLLLGNAVHAPQEPLGCKDKVSELEENETFQSDVKHNYRPALSQDTRVAALSSCNIRMGEVQVLISTKVSLTAKHVGELPK